MPDLLLEAGVAVEVVSPATPNVEAPQISQLVSVVPVVGPAGPPGATYAHHQTSAASQWTVNHNLGAPREPTVLLDSAPTEPVTADVIHPDLNNTLILFPVPVTGWAYL